MLIKYIVKLDIDHKFVGRVMGKSLLSTITLMK